MVGVDAAAKRRIVKAIREAEKGTTGEIRVHLSSRTVEDAYEEAERTFKRLGMHRTKERTGVLVFVSTRGRSFAILGDAGIHAKAGDDFWKATRDRMRAGFEAGRPVEAILEGVRSAGETLKRHFPAEGKNSNELPDTVTED